MLGTESSDLKALDIDFRRHDNPGDNPTKSLVALLNVRVIMLGEKSRKVFFTSTKTGIIQLKVLQVGADAEYEVAIHTASAGVLKGAGVVVEVTKGERVEIELGMKQEYSGAIKVVAYEI